MAKRGKRTDEQTRDDAARDRAAHGQSAARGDTGDGDTGVSRDRQGISNRPGDDVPEPRTNEGDEPGRRGSGELRPPPPTEAGAPPVQEQERSSLDSPSQSGRPRDEGDDRIERTGAQSPSHSEPGAVRPPGAAGPDDNTM
jgi:hypothetical protein